MTYSTNLNVDELLGSFDELEDIPQVSAGSKGGGAYSFGIVNSRNNGKRVTISKALAADLALDDRVELAPNPKAGVLIVGKKLPVNKVSSGNLTGEDKKYCYSAPLVQLLTKVFALNFDDHTSMAFSDVKIEPNNGEPFAVVRIENKYPRTAEEGASA